VNLSLRLPVATNPFQHRSLFIHAELLVNRMDFRIRVTNEFPSYGLMHSCLGRESARTDSPCDRFGNLGRLGEGWRNLWNYGTIYGEYGRRQKPQ
jgi:hypothetical protein